MAKKEEISKAELYRKERKERLAKESKKNAKRSAKTAKVKRALIKVVAIVAAVAIVFGASVAIVGSTGSLLFKPAVAKIGDIKISNVEFQYYYRKTYTNLMETAIQTDQQQGIGYYKSSQGFDYTALPSDQPFPNNLLPEEETKTYATWDDYLTEETLEAIRYLYALEAEAKKANVTLTTEEIAAITSQIEEMRTTAASNNLTLKAYLTMSFGSGINEKNLEAWLTRDALAQKYAQTKSEELTNNITLEAITAEYDKNKQDYSLADFRLYVFSVDTSAIKDGTSEADAKKIRSEAEAKAMKEAKEFMNGVTTEEEFIAAADKLDKEKAKGNSSSSSTTPTQTAEETTKFEKAQYSVLQQAFGDADAKWAMDSSRKVGDKKIMAYKQNDQIVEYYVLFVTKPAYRDNSIPTNIKYYELKYTKAGSDKVDEATKKTALEKANSLVSHWTGHDSKDGTAASFASFGAHVDATLKCTDGTNFTFGKLPAEVDNWVKDGARKHNDVKLIETEKACYVVYFDSKADTANWQTQVKNVMAQNAFTDFEEELLAKPEYTLNRDDKLMTWALKAQKSKINKDLKDYLYMVTTNMQSNAYTY